MFEKIETKIPGLFIIQPRIFTDNRGKFIKLFHDEMFNSLGLKSDFREEYFSTSSKGVVRGLHFQTPPEQHVKCVTCLRGEIFDAVVDLRKESPTYGKNFTIVLKETGPTILYIPEGLAHGFMSLTEKSLFLNKTTTVFNAECDSGILWDSCGINWPDVPVVLSDKDKNMPPFGEYNSPF